MVISGSGVVANLDSELVKSRKWRKTHFLQLAHFENAQLFDFRSQSNKLSLDLQPGAREEQKSWILQTDSDFTWHKISKGARKDGIK